eukprot:2918196-Pleurochrysis_carterae.AAC.1
MSWSAMWALLDARAEGFRGGGTGTGGSRPAALSLASASAVASTEAAAASSSSAPLRRQLHGNALWQALATASRAGDLNIVSHPGQTDADMRRMRPEEDAGSYVQHNLQ